MNSPTLNHPSGNTSMSMGMTPYLHFGYSDPILFNAWRPSSPGTIAGACIGLILFSILERCLTAFRRAREIRWRARPTLASSSTYSFGSKSESADARDPLLSARKPAVALSILSRDIPRGVIQALQSTFSFALMLVVMTFNGAYIVSIIVGLGIGEVLVGRIGREQEEI